MQYKHLLFLHFYVNIILYLALYVPSYIVFVIKYTNISPYILAYSCSFISAIISIIIYYKLIIHIIKLKRINVYQII